MGLRIPRNLEGIPQIFTIENKKERKKVGLGLVGGCIDRAINPVVGWGMARKKLKFKKTARLNLTGEPKLHGPAQLCQNEIARVTGLSPTTVSKALNRGRCGRSSMELISDAIGMSLDQFRETYLRSQAA